MSMSPSTYCGYGVELTEEDVKFLPSAYANFAEFCYCADDGKWSSLFALRGGIEGVCFVTDQLGIGPDYLMYVDYERLSWNEKVSKSENKRRMQAVCDMYYKLTGHPLERERVEYMWVEAWE